MISCELMIIKILAPVNKQAEISMIKKTDDKNKELNRGVFHTIKTFKSRRKKLIGGWDNWIII